MRITLKKKIQLKSIEILAEVDFNHEESPYIELLEQYTNQQDMKQKLAESGVESAAINNILKNLTALGIIENGSIKNIQKGFPEREYGKYEVLYYENDTNLPFKYQIHSIKRTGVVSGNRADRVAKIQSELLKSLLEESRDLSSGKNFRILKIINEQGIHDIRCSCTESLAMVFENNDWTYFFSDIKDRFSMPPIELNYSFRGRWNSEEIALELDYVDVCNDDNAVRKFLFTFEDDLEIPEYGNLQGGYDDIPIIPNESSYRNWFLHLLKEEVQSCNRYFTYDEIEQLWCNLYHKTPQIHKRFELPFDFSSISKEYSVDSELYWLLMTGKDLNPFVNTKSNGYGRNETIEQDTDVELKYLFDRKLDFSNINYLLIIDRYVNTLRHFQSVEAMLSPYNGRIETTIVSQEYYKTTAHEQNLIKEICEVNNIKRIIREKTAIPHDRYWILDKKIFYNFSKSVDFIMIDKEKIDVQHTQIFYIPEDRVEKRVIELAGAING
ncbi:MAG: hypothetical protein JEZ04_21655 [Spirochaetales bacterium]|nr:hypothetical protein [Spirochaetales bacterium]